MKNRPWQLRHDRRFSANRAIVVAAAAVVVDGDVGENRKCYAYPAMVRWNGSQ